MQFGPLTLMTCREKPRVVPGVIVDAQAMVRRGPRSTVALTMPAGD